MQHQYIHYTGPAGVGNPGVAPHSTTHRPAAVAGASTAASAPPSASASAGAGAGASVGNGAPGGGAPLVATGDWTKDLVHLAKTAELKKHALTLQLHTAHILSAHASLEAKSKAIQDIREQKNKLDSERARLLNSLREINEDRDKADLMESSIDRECADIRLKITQLTDGEYALAKQDVDRLRGELGQPPLPSLQSTLDEKKSNYLTDRRLEGQGLQSGVAGPSVVGGKRGAGDMGHGEGQAGGKRPRGRPKGSKNRRGGVAGGDGDGSGM